jgi:hypothetical protein
VQGTESATSITDLLRGRINAAPFNSFCSPSETNAWRIPCQRFPVKHHGGSIDQIWRGRSAHFASAGFRRAKSQVIVEQGQVVFLELLAWQ